MSLLILADDLTGAADCAARCRGAGMPAAIVLDMPTPPLPPGALAFTSDSRHLPPDTAAERVSELMAGLRDQPAITWYKKIDSTLRGNLGAELDAMLDTLGRKHALICPAFPAQGRGLRDGFLVSPAPLTRPIYLPALLAEQSRRPVELIELEDVRSGAAQLAGRLDTAKRAARLLVAEPLTDDDLRALVDAAALALPNALLCGSAGLIGALARGLSGPIRAEAIAIRPGPALLVVGSGSPMARRQIAHLRRHRQGETIQIDPAVGEPDERRTACPERSEGTNGERD